MLVWKKILIVLLCFAAISPKEGVHLGLHVVEMAHHFAHHFKQHHSSISVFVPEHQKDAEHSHHGQEDHHEMPTHKHTLDGFYPFVLLVEKIKLDFKYCYIKQKQKKLTVSQQFISSAFINAIWQPPKGVTIS